MRRIERRVALDWLPASPPSTPAPTRTPPSIWRVGQTVWYAPRWSIRAFPAVIAGVDDGLVRLHIEDAAGICRPDGTGICTPDASGCCTFDAAPHELTLVRRRDT